MKQNIFFTPGPSQLYPTVPAHIETALRDDVFSISHRSKTYEGFHREAVEGLRALLGVPQDFKVLFFSSANEIWERLLQNCVQQHSYHLVNGEFSARFFSFAQMLGKKPVKHEVSFGSGFDLSAISIPQEAELVALIANETSAGVSTPDEDLAAVRSKHPSAILAVDMVSSAPYTRIDFSCIDAAYFSVQKGFGLPAGLGVLIAGPRCFEASAKLSASGFPTGTYHSFAEMLKKDEVFQTTETPNVAAIYLLSGVVKDMLDKGIENIRRETDEKAEMIYSFLESAQGCGIFVAEPRYRSRTVIVAQTQRDSGDIIQTLAAKGLVVGAGYSKFKSQHLRIANFPAVSREDISLLLTEFRNAL